MSDLRVGILGAGYIARAHANAYRATAGVRIVAIADPAPDKARVLADHVGAAMFDDPQSLLDLDLDVISICSPTPTHADLAVAALAAGKSVLCEKPVARTLADATRMVEAAERVSGLFMVGHVSRFEPDHARAKEIVAAGALGEIRMMSQRITSAAPAWSEGSWLLDDAQSGGPIVDLAIHSFDFLAWICGHQPIRVHAVARDTAVGPATYALITLRYGNGAIGLVETSWAHPAAAGFNVATELIGGDGRVWWDYAGVSGGKMTTSAGETISFDPLGERGFRAEIGAFVEAVRAGGPSPIPALDGLNSLRTALGARRSLETGEPVDLPADLR